MYEYPGGIDKKALSGWPLVLPATTSLLHAELNQKKFIESQTTTSCIQFLMIFRIVNLLDSLWQGQKLSCRTYRRWQMIGDIPRIAIYRLLGKAPQRLGVQPFRQ